MRSPPPPPPRSPHTGFVAAFFYLVPCVRPFISPHSHIPQGKFDKMDTLSGAGGCPNNLNFTFNPQYSFDAPTVTNMTVTLSTTDLRWLPGQGEYTVALGVVVARLKVVMPGHVEVAVQTWCPGVGVTTVPG